jgi:hypothetical protein
MCPPWGRLNGKYTPPRESFFDGEKLFMVLGFPFRATIREPRAYSLESI